MKKFFFFVAAALASTAMFADLPEGVVAPSDGVLNAYKADGTNVVMAFYTTAPVCNDIVVAGTYEGWSGDATKCTAVFEAVDGYEGWYVASFADASEDIQAKPVQLKADGSFSWDFQVGNDAEIIRGTATIGPGIGQGEIDIKAIDPSAPLVLYFTQWKLENNPCVTAVKHDYTVILHAPFCADAEGNYFDPALIGDFNGWDKENGKPMNYDAATDTYVGTFNDEEKHSFKFKAATDVDWTNQIQLYNAEEDSWYDNPNITLGAEETIELDYSNGRYTLCVEEENAIENVFAGKVAEKVIENGQLFIVIDGVRYNTVGAIVK